MHTSVTIIYFNIFSVWLLYASEAWRSRFIYHYDDIHYIKLSHACWLLICLFLLCSGNNWLVLTFISLISLILSVYMDCFWTSWIHTKRGYLDEGFYVASMTVTEMFSCILMGLEKKCNGWKIWLMEYETVITMYKWKKGQTGGITFTVNTACYNCVTNYNIWSAL